LVVFKGDCGEFVIRFPYTYFYADLGINTYKKLDRMLKCA